MSVMPSSRHLPRFGKKIEKTFKHIFDKLEREISSEDIRFAK